MARSSAVVSLRLASLPSTSVTASPAHSATAASSVKIVAAGRGRGFVGGQDVRETKALRGLRPPKAGTLDGLGDAAAWRPPASSVSASGTAAMAPGVCVRAPQARVR